MRSNLALADTGSGVQKTWRRRYASLLKQMPKSLYPLDKTATPAIPKPVSIPMTEEEKVEARLIATLWNEFDRVRGVKRARKWEPRSVLKQMVTSGFETFWEQIGGKPPTAALREAAIKAAVRDLESQFSPKKK